jgi:hypothetical protein
MLEPARHVVLEVGCDLGVEGGPDERHLGRLEQLLRHAHRRLAAGRPVERLREREGASDLCLHCLLRPRIDGSQDVDRAPAVARRV